MRLLTELTASHARWRGADDARTRDAGAELRSGDIRGADLRPECGIDLSVVLVENPRSSEMMIEEFGVDISDTHKKLSQEPRHTTSGSVQELLSGNIT